MRSKKKPATKVADAAPVQIGKLKIPTAAIIAVLGLFGVGGTVHGELKSGELEDKVAQLEQARRDIVEIKTDIKWIREKLNGAGPELTDSH